jgi:hypothetical protein
VNDRIAEQVACKLQGHRGVVMLRRDGTQFYEARCADCGAPQPRSDVDLRFV